MPDLSLTQALAELAALKSRVGAPPTIAELRDIVARTRVTQVDPIDKSIDRAVATKATLLYSGRLSPGVESKDIAEAMAKANPELAIINKTHVGELLETDSLFFHEVREAALREGLVQEPSGFQSFINGPSGGFWSKASERFTLAGASGDFIVIAPNITGLVDPDTKLLRPNSVFGTVELKALLDGNATGRICDVHVILHSTVSDLPVGLQQTWQRRLKCRGAGFDIHEGGDRADPVVHAQGPEKRMDMHLHGALRDPQLPCDFLVGFARRESGEDFALTFRQRPWRFAKADFPSLFRHDGGHENPLVVDGFQRLQNLLDGH